MMWRQSGPPWKRQRFFASRNHQMGKKLWKMWREWYICSMETRKPLGQ